MACRKFNLIFLVALVCVVGISGENKESSEELRIVGGSRSRETIPYQVSLQSRAVENIVNRLVQTLLPFVKSDWTHVCGGAIIAERYVLTAAHCVLGSNPKDLSIVAGTKDLAYRAFRHAVVNYVVHPNYRELISSDIAVIQVKDPFLFGFKVQKIDFDDENEVGGGEFCKFYGWGYVTPIRFGIAALSLQTLELKTLDNSECQWKGYNVSDTEICTFRGFVQGLCAGDSGGALVNLERTKIIGIASYSSELCGTGSPDVFTRVSKFVGWIKQQIGIAPETTTFIPEKITTTTVATTSTTTK